MRRTVDVAVLTFAPNETSAVLVHMDRLGARHEGWINLIPLVREEDEPDPPVAIGSLFSASGPLIPVCTWAAGKDGRRGVERDSLGVEHATGTKLVARLAGLGLALPEGWRWEQDHPKRGLVVRPPLETAHEAQLDWVLEAGTALSRVPLTGQWEARVRPGH
ncbi:MAG: hypothetical protein ACRDY1_06580 [Acidimicrobiales bacterium]